MPRLNFKNNSFTTLAEAITTSGQSSFAVVDASALPAVPFRLTILDGSSKGSSSVEIIEVGAKDTGTNVLSSVLRGQEGTTATTHASGVRIENRLTAEAYGNIFSVDEVVIGTGAGGSDNNGVILGVNAKAGNIGAGTGPGHVAIGHEASTEVDNAASIIGGIAIGRYAKSKSSYNVVIGSWAQGGGSGHNNVVSVGLEAKANYGGSVAVGEYAEAGKTNEAGYSVAVGSQAITEAVQCIAIGYYAVAGVNNLNGAYSIAIGPIAVAQGTENIAIGYDAEAGNPNYPGQALRHIAIGAAASTGFTVDETRNNLIAIGYRSWATHTDAIAIGYDSEARGLACIAVGSGALTGNIGVGTGDYHVAIGFGASTQVNSENITGESIAIGYQAKAQHASAVAIGGSANVGANAGVAIGASATVSGSNGVMVGLGGAGYRSIAIGFDTWASGSYSITMGEYAGSHADASAGIAIGRASYAQAVRSIAIGEDSWAGNTDAPENVAIGYRAKARFTNSVAIGKDAEAAAANDFILGHSSHNVKVPGSFEITGSGDGVIVTTPDGTKRYKITVDNAGAVATTLQ